MATESEQNAGNGSANETVNWNDWELLRLPGGHMVIADVNENDDGTLLLEEFYDFYEQINIQPQRDGGVAVQTSYICKNPVCLLGSRIPSTIDSQGVLRIFFGDMDDEDKESLIAQVQEARKNAEQGRESRKRQKLLRNTGISLADGKDVSRFGKG